jgi:hypothetical protein
VRLENKSKVKSDELTENTSVVLDYNSNYRVIVLILS